MSKEKFTLYSRYFWTLLLTGAGLSHFVLTDFLLAQMPPYMPQPLLLIYLSGVYELALALLLQSARWRQAAWWGIAAMCAVYVPVHWHVLVNEEALGAANGPYHIPYAVALVRLPVQFVFIGWAAWLGRSVKN